MLWINFYRLFTDEEIEQIKAIKLSDVLLTTNTLAERHVPKDAFSTTQNRRFFLYFIPVGITSGLV